MAVRLLHGTSSFLMEYHHALMPFTWSVLSDISILFALNPQLPFSFLAHVLAAITASAITIATSLGSLLRGIPQPGNPMRLHKITGAFIYLLIGVQIICGIASKIVRSSKNVSGITIKLKKIHAFIGYSMSIIAKLQVLNFLDSSTLLFWFNLIWDIVLIVLLIRKKCKVNNLEQSPSSQLHIQSCKIVKSFSQVQLAYPHAVIYGNFIYNGYLMKHTHPGGFQVINKIKGRCIERYLYGMHNYQLDMGMNNHSHTKDSIALLGKPLAKLEIEGQYLNFGGDSFKVAVKQIEIISQSGGIYVIRLKIKQNQMVQYQGYSELNQLGRYYSLTKNKSLTRLYTAVNFLNHQNISLIERLLPSLKLQHKLSLQNTLQDSLQEMNELVHRQTTIPLMVKVYNDGRFTQDFIHDQVSNLELSCLKGRGLELGEIEEGGRVVIVAAGTGLFPFCDLIDLLFKQELLSRSQELRTLILNKNPILANPILRNNPITLLLAVNFQSEIHKVIWQQLTYLAKNLLKFQFFLRVKEPIELPQQIIRLSTSFQSLLSNKVESQRISKVLVCGPCKLNISLQQFFRNINFHNYTIL